MTALTSSRARALSGTIRVPGDKSISHRALMFGALAHGTTTIHGLLEGEDVLSTAAALRAMGAQMEESKGVWTVTGLGPAGLAQPPFVLDMGNSGTSARLMAGIIAGYPVSATMIGDASLSRRPMKRVMDPLAQMGATFESNDGHMPLTIHGRADLKAIDYVMPVASAQVKSAILLAGLNARGTTRVHEPKPTRDHTERMLAAFGVTCTTDGRAVSIAGGQKLTAPRTPVIVPGDPSSAAFPVVAALLVDGSDVTIENVGLNPTRTGLFDTLRDMGGRIDYINPRNVGGEPVADLRVRASKLHGVTVPQDRVPSMIDEFPVLFVAASCAQGETFADGLDELRVKESDRLKTMAENLAACGVKLEEGDMSLRIFGTLHPPAGGATVKTHLDHRIAMAHLVLGAAAQNPVAIDDAAAIATSFPNFVSLMNGLGMTVA